MTVNKNENSTPSEGGASSKSESMIFENVAAIVRAYVGDKAKGNMTMETTFLEIGADSLDVVEVVMHIEETYHISVEDDDIAKVTCLADLVKYIQERI